MLTSILCFFLSVRHYWLSLAQVIVPKYYREWGETQNLGCGFWVYYYRRHKYLIANTAKKKKKLLLHRIYWSFLVSFKCKDLFYENQFSNMQVKFSVKCFCQSFIHSTPILPSCGKEDSLNENAYWIPAFMQKPRVAAHLPKFLLFWREVSLLFLTNFKAGLFLKNLNSGRNHVHFSFIPLTAATSE